MSTLSKLRTKKAQQLMWRWVEQEDIRHQALQIKAALEAGSPIAGMSPFGFLEGLEDFRGISIGTNHHQPHPNINLPANDQSEKCWDRCGAKSVLLESMDFSYANFADSSFDFSKIRNCTFNVVTFMSTIFDGCTISNSVFTDCDFRSASFGPMSHKNEFFDNYIRECEFNKCNFIASSQRSSTFHLCHFHDCSYTDTEWEAVRLPECRFTGAVKRLWLTGLVRKLHSDQLPAPDYLLKEQAIDFSEAKLVTVSLDGHADYSKCKFPCDENQFAILNPGSIIEKANRMLEGKYDNDGTQGKELRWRVLNKQGKYENQQGIVVDNIISVPSNVLVMHRDDNRSKKEKPELAEVREAFFETVRAIAERDGKIIR